MIEQDTIRLLRECDAGVRMGVDSICQVLEHVRSRDLKSRLERSKAEHDKLASEIEKELARYEDEGKAPNPIAKTMSTMKTNMELMMHEDDATIASLMTDGCGMGVKSLNKYLNEFEAADERSKDICKRLIQLEESLIHQIRDFL